MKSHPIVFVYLLLFGLALSSCGRPSDDMGRVSIYFPETYYTNNSSQQNSSNYVSNILNIANANTQSITSVSDWAPIVPTGYQVGRYDTNCLLVVATGPQLDSHACFKTSVVTGKATNVLFFGEMSEPTGVGGEKASLEVLAGSNRVFILLGMHAVSYSDCKKMTDPTFDRSKLSKPYIIGKSESVSVESGRDNRFSITVTPINTDNYIDYCESTEESQIETPPVVRTVGGFEVSVDNTITGPVAHHGQCVPVSVKLKDSTGLHVISSPYTTPLSLSTSTGNLPTMYKSGTGCISETPSEVLASFTTTDLYEARVWIKAASSDNSKTLTLTGAVSDTVTVSDGTNSSSVNVIKSHVLSFLPDAATKGPMLVAPEKIVNDVCYPVTFTTGLPSFSQAAVIDTSVVTDLTATIPFTRIGAQVLFYEFADNTCAGIGASISSSSAGSNNTSRTRFFKATGFEPGDVINLSSFVSGSQYKMVKKMVVQEQDTLIERLALDGPKDLLNPAVDLGTPANSTNCYGPYRAYVVNKRGAAVAPVNSATQQRVPIPIMFSFDSSLGTRLYRRATDASVVACEPSHAITTTNSESIDADTGFFEFYIKITERTQTAASLARYVSVYDPNNIGNRIPPASIQLKIHTTAPLPPNEPDPPQPYCSGGRLGNEVNCVDP